MFLPVGDAARRETFPFVNYALLLVNLGVYAFLLTLEKQIAASNVDRYVLDPLHPTAAGFVGSMFLHATLLHLLGNMLFLWIVGDNVEDRYGHLMYLVFYLAAGIAAGLVHVISDRRPAIGASGAISGVMGAYLVLFPRAKILVLWLLLWPMFLRVPSYIFIGIWFGLQLVLLAVPAVDADPSAQAIAVWAHLGGFVFGLVATLALRLLGIVTPGRYLGSSEAR